MAFLKVHCDQSTKDGFRGWKRDTRKGHYGHPSKKSGRGKAITALALGIEVREQCLRPLKGIISTN